MMVKATAACWKVALLARRMKGEVKPEGSFLGFFVYGLQLILLILLTELSCAT